jgi:F-type H+-transporting ATPase subunit a
MNLAAGPPFTVPDINELFTYKSLVHPFKIGPIVFHITFLTIIMFVLSFLLCALFIAAFRRPAVVPGKLQNLMEAAIDAVRENIVLQTIGPDGDRFMPYLTAVFFFVFAMNFMEIVPGVQVPLTSFMAVPALFSAMAYLIFNYIGIRKQGPYHYVKDTMFPPGVPKPLYVILTPIEVVSKFVFRPITLAVRLFANMMAGHVMLTIFFIASTYFLFKSQSLFLHVISPFPILLAIILTGFELFIALIQAFIITILTAVYIDESLHPAH